MLNKIWFWLLCIGIVYGFAKSSYQSFTTQVQSTSLESGPAGPDSAGLNQSQKPIGLSAMGRQLNQAVLDAATTSVTICIGLIGFMALWLGLLNVAKDAGLVDAFTRLLQPLMRLVFPEVPDGHPAQGAMLMNLSANMLGLDNAATPMGLKAMRDLQTLNPVKDTATNSMAMFLAVNTSSITLIPFTIIGYRALKGSENPASPIAGTLLATLASTIAAVLITRWMSRWPRFQVDADTLAAEALIPSDSIHEEGT
jgi:spore maturation protein A